MIRIAQIALIALVTLAAGGCAPEAAEDQAPATTGEQAADHTAIAEARATVEAFHAALSAADSAAVLERLHPEALIYESGHAETVAEYRAGHLAADIRFAAATEREVLSEQSIAMGPNVLFLSETRVYGRLGERDIDSRGVETMVLAPDGDAWLIRHIHWSNR